MDVTLRITVSPGSEEYKAPKIIDFIGQIPGVADVERVDE